MLASHNLKSFADRFIKGDCRLWHFGDSTGAEMSQSYPTMPTLFRYANGKRNGRRCIGSRFRVGDWKWARFSEGGTNFLENNALIPGTDQRVTGKPLYINLSSATPGVIYFRTTIGNGFGSPARRPWFGVPPWVHPGGMKFAVTHHRTTESIGGINLRPLTGEILPITFRNATHKSGEGVFTDFVVSNPPFGSSYTWTAQLQYSTSLAAGGNHLTIYDFTMSDPNYQIGDNEFFFCGSRSRGGDTILAHLPSGYYPDDVGVGPSGTYTDDNLRYEMNPGGDTVYPNTFTVMVLNSHTPTEGFYSAEKTTGQMEAIEQHFHDFHDRMSNIAALAGCPVKEQRWLYLSSYAAWAAGGTNADTVQVASDDRAEAIRNFAVARGPEVSFLDFNGKVFDTFGLPSLWKDDFLSDDVHPDTDYIDDPEGERSFVDGFGQLINEELLAAQGVDYTFDPTQPCKTRVLSQSPIKRPGTFIH